MIKAYNIGSGKQFNNLSENLEVLIQDTDAISTKLEDLAISSKTERVDINENLISLSKTIHDLTDQVTDMNQLLNEIQSTEQKSC